MTSSFGPSEFVSIYRDAIKDLKSASDKLPSGKERDAVAKLIQQAEAKLERADAELASKLGFYLCKCEFPGNPMLWREAEGAFACPKCGHRRRGAGGPAKVSPNRHDRAEARRGQANDDWDTLSFLTHADGKSMQLIYREVRNGTYNAKIRAMDIPAMYDHGWQFADAFREALDALGVTNEDVDQYIGEIQSHA